MIQSVQTTINNCIWVEAFLIMYAKSTTLTKQNSVSVTGLMRIEARPENFESEMFSATGIQRNTMVR